MDVGAIGRVEVFILVGFWLVVVVMGYELASSAIAQQTPPARAIIMNMNADTVSIAAVGLAPHVPTHFTLDEPAAKRRSVYGFETLSLAQAT